MSEAERAKAEAETARAEMERAKAEAEAAQAAVDKIEADAVALAQRVDAAVDELTKATTSKQRAAAKTKLEDLQREKAELEARIKALVEDGALREPPQPPSGR